MHPDDDGPSSNRPIDDTENLRLFYFLRHRAHHATGGGCLSLIVLGVAIAALARYGLSW